MGFLTLASVTGDGYRILFFVIKTISFFWRVGKMDRTVMLLKETSGKGGLFGDHTAPVCWGLDLYRWPSLPFRLVLVQEPLHRVTPSYCC